MLHPHSSGMLRSVDCYLVTDVSEQPVCLISGSGNPKGIDGSRTEACKLSLQESAHILASNSYICADRIVTSVPENTYQENS